MFKKLFGRKETPINGGRSASSGEVDETSLVKHFILELSNMEGSPTYKLTHQLTVGSEVGNIVIADPSVSPRHCTFILQEEVVSVLDHGSVAGTFINGQKIPPGRYIILEETDNIQVGDLEVQIHVKNETAARINSDDTLEEAEEEVNETEEEEMEEAEEGVKEVKEKKTSFFKRFFKAKNKTDQETTDKDDYRRIHKKEFVKEDRKTKNVSLAGNSPYATNSLVRVLAVISDLIIAYALYIILAPFDEFQSFVHDVPGMIQNLSSDVDWNGIWTTLNQDYSFVGELFKDIYNFFSISFHLGPLILLFILLRLITTLMFGVSISEAFLGVRSHRNAFWKRFGGVLRVIIGIITGPFIIFDIPSVVSRRTFKEIITYTHTYVISKFYTILGVILYMPLLVAVALLAPLIQGLELPEPIAVKDKLERRIKVIQPADATVEAVKTKDFSRFMNMEIEFDSQNISLIPSIEFTEMKKKLSYRPALNVYHKDLQRGVQLEVFKTFDFKELLGISMRGDFILQEKFPLINEFVHSEGVKSEKIKSKKDENENQQFADQVVAFTKIALELNAENSFDVMQMYTPYLKGLLDFKASFLSLLEYKKMEQIDFIKLGNAFFLRISYKTQKPFDLIIPLIRGPGRIFKVEFDKRQDLAVLRNKFYKFTLDQANWFPETGDLTEGDTLKPLEVVDFLSKLDEKGEKIDSNKAQALYGFYFEKSAEILKRNDAVEYEIWKQSVRAVSIITQKMKDSIPVAVAPAEPAVTEPAVAEPAVPEPAVPAPAVTKPAVPGTLTTPVTPEVKAADTVEIPAEVKDDPRIKLFQNFQDLKDAVENKKNEYFAIEESVKI